MERTALNRAIAEKRRLLYERHGGIMTPASVAEELGYAGRASYGDQWARENDIPAIRIGPRKRGYETDLVAKSIVQRRGML